MASRSAGVAVPVSGEDAAADFSDAIAVFPADVAALNVAVGDSVCAFVAVS